MSFALALSDDDTSEPDVIVNFMGRRNCLPEDEVTDANSFANYHVEQYAVGVLDFSSQYGIDYSISYTAPNIIGRPIKYPMYGDYPETFAMRTYGNWWHKAPSGTREIQPQNIPTVSADDFIVLFFEDYIIPKEIAIFETFNPGAVVRIWGFTIAKKWVILWEAQDFHTETPYSVALSRRFAPTIKKITLPIKTVRLEFNHKYLNYYTEIDAVLLSGQSVNVHHMHFLMREYWDKRRKNKAKSKSPANMELQRTRENDEAHLRALSNANDESVAADQQGAGSLANSPSSIDFEISETSSLSTAAAAVVATGAAHASPTATVVAQQGDSLCPSEGAQQNSSPAESAQQNSPTAESAQQQSPTAESACDSANEPNEDVLTASLPDVFVSHLEINDLPFEILLKIFGYLDLESLFIAGLVSRTFNEISNHPLLYSEINLKPYWNVADSELLCILARRATMLRKLDLSWCGLFNTISPTEFKKFITQRGDNLTHLRLNSCKFLNATCIETLGIVCDNLVELSLRNCTTEPPLLNFSCLANLKNLERLDLFQTAFESELLLAMLESNQKLKHLNLAFCGVNVNMDDVAAHIGTYNKGLISLDMWKSHSLSARGLICLAKCALLEELDIGWCLREAPIGDSLQVLLSKCPKFKKLFLSTVRGITERDLIHIGNYCQHLEQLDLMGILCLTPERIYELLTKLPKLKLLDVSFCDNILEQDIDILSRWSRRFNVQIKCSHVPYL